MWTLNELREEYDRLDRFLGLDTTGIRLSFSRRMQRQHGVCCFRGDLPVEIRLADFLRTDDEAFVETARHEYAHAAAALLTGRRHGHDALWKQLCCKIGCRPERLAAPCPMQERRNDARGYLVRCKACGAESRYLRRGPVVQSIEAGRRSCRCRRCGGSDFTLERMNNDDKRRTSQAAV